MTDVDVKDRSNEIYKANLSDTFNISKILTDNGCDDVLVLDVSLLCDLAQFFIIATTKSSTQLFGVYKYVEDYIKEKGLPLLNKKNKEMGDSWLLIDVNSIVVHLMDQNSRSFYELEKLWYKAKIIDHSSKSS